MLRRMGFRTVHCDEAKVIAGWQVRCQVVGRAKRPAALHWVARSDSLPSQSGGLNGKGYLYAEDFAVT